MDFSEQYDVAVIGAGHAGCEAALASARLGCSTLLLTVNIENIALMPCNPSIGGPAKGHLVREIDALGGEMGIVADKASIQMRTLNTAKGAAVHALRSQEDKALYQQLMKCSLEAEDNLYIRQAMVEHLVFVEGQLRGFVTEEGIRIACKALILATGTYLKSKIVVGNSCYSGGPSGQRPSNLLSESLLLSGIRLRRFKTGTPARIDSRSVNFDKMMIQPGDPSPQRFSFIGDFPSNADKACWLTYTTEETHQIIRDNLYRAPLYSGLIEGTGPRYCPSIEVKIVNFPDKVSHQVFVEPEGRLTNEFYVQGMSTSLPVDVQVSMLRSVPGLENVRIIRYGYAIEYDCVDPLQLSHSLEFKDFPCLFSAGQINGSSGYEEAAAQGIVAGINAARRVKGLPLFSLKRSEAYIGVLIDDLVTKGTNEPYRIMTSRAEHRLLLRQDNADIRLTALGYEIGLASRQRFEQVENKRRIIADTLILLRVERAKPSTPIQELMEELGQPRLTTGISLFELLKRPGISYGHLCEIFDLPKLCDEVTTQIEVMIKYEGYIKKQSDLVLRTLRNEDVSLPLLLDYSKIPGISNEARQKLIATRPVSIGQASRISGVSPADISILLVYTEQFRRRKDGKA